MNNPSNENNMTLKPESTMTLIRELCTGRLVRLGLALAGAVLLLAATASATTITVTGKGDTIALDGTVTLREAITAANTNAPCGDAPAGSAGLDIIKFNIPGGVIQTITLTAQLPPMPEPITIDGTSQPGYAGTPVIELNGNHVVDTGLFLYGGNSIVKGLVINRFQGIGILISTKGMNFVLGNYVGTNVAGTAALGNGTDGISIQASSTNTIGGSTAFRNVISGNLANGILISSGSDNNTIQGNYIGTNAAGTAALGNGATGIRIFSTNNVIGGTGVPNIISSNVVGLSMESSEATGNQVQGNLIGTNATGTAALGNSQDGVYVSGPGNLIGGTTSAARNILSGNTANGVLIIGAGATGNQILGNYIGTDVTGNTALANSGYGIRIFTANNVIGGLVAGSQNVISGNYRGIGFEGVTATGNQVQGNFIGINSAGAALGNNQEGISIYGNSNVIGGTVAAARNIVSCNRTGVSISGASNQVQGNFIGTNPAGNAALGNNEGGVRVSGPGNFIGGTAAGAGNVISGNSFAGIYFTGSTATGNRLQGNLIGTDAAGTGALGNSGEGVRVIEAPNTVIGGAVTGARNIISANVRGVSFEGTTSGGLQGNYIGTDITGNVDLGNSYEGVGLYSCSGTTIGGTPKGVRNVISGNDNDGVYITGGSLNHVEGNFIGTKVDGISALSNLGAGVDLYSSFNNTIGGTTPSAANVIASNNYCGVLIQSGTGNALLGNSIVNNARLGINLDRTDPFGLLENDLSDPDLNANKRQNYPMLTSVTVSGGNTSIQGTLNSTPNTQFHLEFFANSACSGSGFGEGQVLLGSASVTTNASGNATINTTLGVTPAGQFVAATATSPGGDTSEFSPCALIGGANPGVIQFLSSFFLVSEIDGTAKITVTRSGGMLGTTTVHYATSDDIATTPADYASTSGTLTFGDGEIIKTFTIPVVNDNVAESQETLNLTLSAPTGGAGLGSYSNAKLYINNYDPTYPETHISDASVVEGNVGTTNAVFHVTVTPHSNVITVSYITADGTAHAGVDYETTSGTFTFNPGETSKDVIVPVIGDSLVEGDELFFLNLHTLSAGYVVKGQGEGIIIDDDGLATFEFSSSAYSVNENAGSLDVTVTRGGDLSTAVSVDYATSDDIAIAGQDYTANSGNLNFAAGQTTQVFTVNISDDVAAEGPEKLNLKLSNPSSGSVLGSPSAAVLTIVDNEAQPQLSISDVTQAEGNSGTTSFTFNVTLSGASNQNVSVNYATIGGGTATLGNDYQPTSGMLTFAPGETSKPVSVPVNADSQDEPDETFIVQLSGETNATLAKAMGNGTIVNDDSIVPGTVQFNAASYSVQEDLTAVKITVTRTGDTSGTATVDYATSNGTAAQKGDYELASGTVSFGSGDVSKSFSILINEDSYVEGTETVNLTLSNPSGASLGAQSTAVLSINDDSPELVTNPNDDAQNFVYQQYHDLLNREPDAGGLAYWTGQITQCGNDQNCINTKRKDISAAFYIELEFQETGYFVYRVQKASYGVQPTYQQFMADRGQVKAGPQLEQSKQAFAAAWVQRAAFKVAYPDALPADQFVNKLYDTAGLMGYQTERLQAIQDLMTNTRTRAQILRDVLETPEFKTKEYNPSFVLMQYFGYLRRNADPGGYQFWLNVINNQLPNDLSGYHAMVCAFITSSEYQDRFSALHTHGNAECGQ